MSGTHRSAPLHPLLAGSLIFFVSGAVLVLEILAARLLAPYVGLSLETYTAIIGVVLAGISAGTWAGGRLADRMHPRWVLGPVVILGGLLSMATLPAVRTFGELAEGRAWHAVTLITVLCFFLPSAILSATNPLVVKLQLQSLNETGQVVGRLSALGTAGAILGTFLTGFVLLPSFPASRVVLVLGALLTASGCALILLRGRGLGTATAISILAGLLLGVVGARADSRCHVETPYFCAVVAPDYLGDPSRHVLKLDSLSHSYVDVDDPLFLGFVYIQRLGNLADVMRPPQTPIAALHIGGGGFTMPRYLAASRPGTDNVILELDEELVDLAKERLGLTTGPRMRVEAGDARVTIRELGADSFDLVIGDAFAGPAVPWHLTSREALEQVRRVLRERGIYAMNLIDDGPRNFLRAEIRTFLDVFERVALLARPSLRTGVLGTSNYILLGSDGRIPVRRLRARLQRRGGDAIVVGTALQRFVGDARLLTDDYAPADQLYTR